MAKQKLRLALKVNGVFSLLSGTSAVVFDEFVSGIMGITTPQALEFIGVGLLMFAAFVLYNAFKKNINRRMVSFIIFQDWLWVLGSVLIVSFQFFDLNLEGYGVVTIIALIVASFASLQYRFLRLIYK